jgi:sensor domain CHASE-containing protein
LKPDEGKIMNPDSVHRILEPLLLALAISLVLFAIATVLLWRHGKRAKAEEAAQS